MSIFINSFRFGKFSTKSLLFDGVDEHCTLTTINLGKTYTVSVWLKWGSLGGIPLGHATAPPLSTYFFFLNAGDILVNRGNDNKRWAFVPTLGVWHNVIAVRSNSLNEELFINGISQGTRLFGTNVDMSLSFFGAQDGGNTFFDGNIDACTTWNTAFNATQIAELYGPGRPSDPTNHSLSANLKHQWHFGELDDSVTLVKDRIGSSDATPVNMEAGDFVEDTA